MISRHLERLDEQIAGLSARVNAAMEKYQGARAATVEAACALSLSSEDGRLQLRLRRAERWEQMTKRFHDNAQERLEETLRSRQAMEAMLKSKCERALLCASVNVPYSVVFAHWLVVNAQHHMTMPRTRLGQAGAAQDV